MSSAHSYTSYIRTTPELLWTALTTPQSTLRYFDLMAGFMMVESDWTPGAALAYRTADRQIQITGQVLEIDAPHRLVTQLSLRYDPQLQCEPPSRLRWEIAPLDDVCRLVVVHDQHEAAPGTARDVAVCMPSILSNLKVLLETGRPRLIKAIVFDCAEPARVAAFWAEALGYVMQGPPPTAADDFVGIADPHGIDTELGFQRVAEPKTTKNRVHLDLHVDNMALAIERLLASGARIVRQFDAWTVMADSEGSEFCVLE